MDYKDGDYLRHNPTWHSEDSLWKANYILEMMARNNIHPSAVAEVGCGVGGILAELQQRMGIHVSYVGYDISPDAIQLSKQRENSALRFFQRNLLEEDCRHFDVLLCIDVFEHIENYYGFLRDLKTKSEYKIFHIPLDISVQTVLRNSPLNSVRALVGHLHCFTKDQAMAALEDTGYEILDCFYTAHGVELVRGKWRKLLMKWPRQLLFRLFPNFTVRLLGGYSLMVLAR